MALVGTIVPRVGQVRRRFGAFIRDHVNAGADERDRDATECQPESMRAARDAGLFSVALPRELGGEGADLFEWGSVLEQIGYLSEGSSFPALLSARVWLTDTLFATGRPDVIERYLRSMARAERFAR